MRADRRHIRQSEEIPRRLGLTLVVVHVGGLCLVALVAIMQTHDSYLRQMTDLTRRQVEQVCTSLAGPSEDRKADAQRALREVTKASLPWEQLRIVDDDRIIASIRTDEVDQSYAPLTPGQSGRPTTLSLAHLGERDNGDRRALVRSPIGTGTSSAMYLEGIALLPHWQWTAAAVRAWTLVAILGAVGSFGLVYHLLRRHFRGASAIAENLVHHGEHIERELASLRVADELGAVASCWNRLIDITEELQREQARSTAASELARVLDRGAGGVLAEALHTIDDGLLVVDAENRVLYANSTMLRFLGLKSLDVNERTHMEELETSPRGQRLLEAMQTLRRESGERGGQQAIHHEPSDESSYRLCVTSARAGKQGAVQVLSIGDISQQIRADKAREEFVSQVTHELRTPLTNIRAYAETLSSGVFDDPKVIADCYNVITAETRRLSRLIEDMLSLSQLEVGTMLLARDDVEMHRLLSETVRDLRGLADEKEIDLQLTLPAKLPMFFGDRDKLSVVLNNLMGNAIKYTPRKGHVQVECTSDDEELRILVADNGLGIDPAEHERIFERYQRSHDPAVRQEMGTGIGLTTAREIVRRHGGDIELDSEKGKGSRFTIRLPLSDKAVGASDAAGEERPAVAVETGE